VTASSTPGPKPTPNGAVPATLPAAPETEPSIGQLVSDASAHLSTLVHSEIELAKLELRSSVKNAGVGIGFFAGAVVLIVFSLVYGFQSLAEGIAAMGVYRWLAFLIVFLLQVAFAAVCGYLGYRKVKRVKAPERTMKTTRETVDYLKTLRG